MSVSHQIKSHYASLIFTCLEKNWPLWECTIESHWRFQVPNNCTMGDIQGQRNSQYTQKMQKKKRKNIVVLVEHFFFFFLLLFLFVSEKEKKKWTWNKKEKSLGAERDIDSFFFCLTITLLTIQSIYDVLLIKPYHTNGLTTLATFEYR